MQTYCQREEASFEWSQRRISSIDFKIRTTLYGIINSTTRKYCSRLSVKLNGHILEFNVKTKKVRTTLRVSITDFGSEMVKT